MPELFVELLSEEIPARLQRRAAEDLQRLVTGHLVDAGLTYEGAYATATPRRLVLSVSGLPARSADRREERKGPRVGAPQKAIEGFLRAAGLSSIDEAEIQSDPRKGDFYVARTVVAGRETLEVAADAIAEAVRRFPWPVSMRWGAASTDPGALRWVRPLTAIVATFGTENEDPEIVPVALPVPVGDTTVGHRVHAPGPIRVRRLDDYKASLERAHVVVDRERRRDQILHDARDAVFALGLELVEDEALLAEVAGLVEWPVVLVGRFDAASLELPEEVIRLTIRQNQKCFVTRDPATGRLANAFVLTANVAAPDGGAAIIAGNERVVRARLADARFFYEQDLKVPLEEHARKLAGVTFHEKLGSQADRVERIAALAREIAPAVGADPDAAERAARLAKADLVTAMVGEFPELQGYMGRRYAEAQGVPDDVAAAIEEHYAPQGPDDAVPQGHLSILLALADKLDTLVSLWAAGERPTGSGDALGLRRAALGIIRNILVRNVRIDLFPIIDKNVQMFVIRDSPRTISSGRGLGLRQSEMYRELAKTTNKSEKTGIQKEIDEINERLNKLYDRSPESDESGLITQLTQEVAIFVIDRYVNLITIENSGRERAEAVTTRVLNRIDLVDITNRITALTDFLATDDGANLMAGPRRATNILRAEEKKDGEAVVGGPDRAALVEPQEIALADAVATARMAVTEAVGREHYAGAMTALAALRAPVDAFFDAVLVNADDPGLRLNRLRLLAALRDVTREVADFSAISG